MKDDATGRNRIVYPVSSYDTRYCLVRRESFDAMTSSMADPSVLFEWLALSAIGLMSVTVPTYAISVSFISRERRRAISERERRIEELQKKIQELSNRVRGDPGVVALQSEIASYNKDIKKIKGRVDSLSVYYACFFPLFCFATSIFFAAWGFLVFIGTVGPLLGITVWESSVVFAGWAITWLMVGTAFLSNTLIHVNRAATNPETLSAIRLSFVSGSTAEKFSAGQQQGVSFLLHNFGKEMGEKVTAMIYFPDDFKVAVLPLIPPNIIPARVHRQPTAAPMTYPNRMTASVELGDLHEDMAQVFTVNLTMPSSVGTYKVPAETWERRLGKSEQELTFEITPAIAQAASPTA